MRLVKAFAIGGSVLGVVIEALPGRAQSLAKRQVTELRDEYDFVIVGGGTAGLTVAHRVSAAFPKSERICSFTWLGVTTSDQLF